MSLKFALTELNLSWKDFGDYRELPDPVDAPRQWFCMVDFDGSGTLTRKDVVEAMKAQLRIKVGLKPNPPSPPAHAPPHPQHSNSRTLL